MKTIFKILAAELWQAAVKEGVFRGAGIDLEDGYIHFSTAEQVRETADRHFAGQPGLVLLAIDGDQLGDQLKWETSRGGALFPHLYRNLKVDEVSSCSPMPIGEDGKHVFPDNVS